MQLSRNFIVGAVALLLLVLFSGSWYYFFNVSRQKALLRGEETLQNARNILYTSGGLAAIPYLEQAVRESANNTQKAQAEVNLANAYVSSGERIEEGIELWKSISLNEGYPANYRSSAAQSVLGHYNARRNIDFALAHIFTGPVWGGFIEGKSKDEAGLKLAMRDGYEWILSFDDSATLFMVAYQLARRYANPPEQDLVQSKKYLGVGDTVFQRALAVNAAARESNPNAPLPFADHVIGNALVAKAQTLAAFRLARFDGVTFGTVEEAHKQIFSFLGKDSTKESNNVSTLLFAYYNFADFLRKDDAVKNSQQILETLAPIYVLQQKYPQASFFAGFLKVYGTDLALKTADARKDILALTVVDPRFKTLLINLGWQANDFD